MCTITMLAVWLIIIAVDNTRGHVVFEEREKSWITQQNDKLIIQTYDSNCRDRCRATKQCRAYLYYSSKSDSNVKQNQQAVDKTNSCWLYRSAKFRKMPKSSIDTNKYNAGVQVRKGDSTTNEFARIQNTKPIHINGTMLYELNNHGSFTKCEGACVRTDMCDSYTWEPSGLCQLWQGLDFLPSKVRSKTSWNSGFKLCPLNYIIGVTSPLHPTKCYRFDLKRPVNQESAIQKCADENAELVSIESQEESEFLSNYYLHSAPRKKIYPENNCVFPFEFGGINFTTCISTAIGNKSFCGTDVKADSVYSREECKYFQGFWTSGYLSSTNTWLWNSTNNGLRYRRGWGEGQPNNATGMEKCLAVSQVLPRTQPDKINFEWMDADCSWIYNYICERKVTGLLENIKGGKVMDPTVTSGQDSNAYIYAIVAVVLVIILAALTTVIVCTVRRKRQNMSARNHPHPLPRPISATESVEDSGNYRYDYVINQLEGRQSVTNDAKYMEPIQLYVNSG